MVFRLAHVSSEKMIIIMMSQREHDETMYPENFLQPFNAELGLKHVQATLSF